MLGEHEKNHELETDRKRGSLFSNWENNDGFSDCKYMKIISVHCGRRNENYEHYWTSSWNKAWKKFSDPYGIWTHDLCDTGAALYKLLVQ